ncbi:p21-C-terminal region-binding protein-domain-containing protein [Abortiporus biennis]|nr:p21-C-terminal region-binding protein-domain-containing protein [Abortiporus biennis]
MSKRRTKQMEEDDDDGDDSLVNVDFEFFDPNPEVDYLAIKRLSTQLFQGDAEALELQDLADLILGQPLVGTTVKCDGKESDPYAFLTVLNMHVHQKRLSIKALIDYASSKTVADPDFHATLQTLLSPAGLQSQNHVGFVYSERLINMPVQVVPPMYRMLSDEIQWALDDNEPYRFSHLLFISRIYRLSSEEAAELQARSPRKQQENATAGVFSFHPEDEYIQKFATHSIDYSFSNVQPRDKDSFGLDTGGRMMLVPAANLPQLITTLNEVFAPPS